MTYLVVVGHAGFAEGLGSALSMLLGERAYARYIDLEEGMAPEAFERGERASLVRAEASDAVVLLADLIGGTPARVAEATIDALGLPARAFGGCNLAMAIAATMGIEDELDLDTIADAVLDEAARSVRAF